MLTDKSSNVSNLYKDPKQKNGVKPKPCILCMYSLSGRDARDNAANKIATGYIRWYKWILCCRKWRYRPRYWCCGCRCVIYFCSWVFFDHELCRFGIIFWQHSPYVFEFSHYLCHWRSWISLVFATFEGQCNKFLYTVGWIRSHSCINDWEDHAGSICIVDLIWIKRLELVRPEWIEYNVHFSLLSLWCICKLCL